MGDLSQRLAALSPAKRRLLEKRLAASRETAEPIAIVGMGCRFAGVRNPDEFWRLIREGTDATGEIPASRWDADALYDKDPDAPGKMATRWGGFVADVEFFDPQFFGIAPREASRMDPQQRLLLEVAWEAMEQGNQAPSRLAGSQTGVFVGIGGTDYSKIPTNYEDYYSYLDAHVGTGNALSIAANRLSYIFDFHGPSLAVDTACSSSSVAIHLAVQSLRHRQCDAALAGGVNLILTPDVTLAFSKARMLSPDGQCRPFDAGANGYVRGEGCGIIVLKRLTDAVAAGDTVLGVLRGTAVNQDGRTSGITAPNSVSQQACIKAALADAGLAPAAVNYIEAHGTGTPLGDPIEVEALTKVFRKKNEDEPPVYVTSVKGNIGHTETVSGVAGVIKVLLMMQHGRIPPQSHFQKLNPYIQLEGSRLQIATEAIDWPADAAVRVAGVSSFGFGGTNAHLVLQQAAAAPSAAADDNRADDDRAVHVLSVSAKTDSALAALAGDYAEHLRKHPELALTDICYSANCGRTHFNQRAAIVVDSHEALIEKLSRLSQGKPAAGIKHRQVRVAAQPNIGMLFTGQGSQYVGMGRELLETQPTFRAALMQCDEILRDQLERPLLSVIYPDQGATSPLDQTGYTQPALFALEYALAMLWKSWGVEPRVVMGHSVGQYVAACVAGVFSLEDGLTLIAHRARLMQQLPAGGLMAVVFADPERVARDLKPLADRVSVAAANGPENTTISGDAAAVRSLLDQYAAQQIDAQLLTVSHAFHSPLMDPMLDEFERLAGNIDYQAPRIPLVSNLTGEIVSGRTIDARYWRDHVRGTVRFADGMQRLVESDLHALVEVGPTASLLGMGRRCAPQWKGAWLPSLRQGKDACAQLLDTLAELYVLGANIDWQQVDAERKPRRVSLPTYPFERTRHWMDPRDGQARAFTGSRGADVHPLLGSPVPTPLATTLLEGRLNARSPKYLVDHQVQGSIVVPGAVYFEMGLAAAQHLFGPGLHALENVSVQQAMFLSETGGRAVQTSLAPESGGQSTFEIHSAPADATADQLTWQLHATGQLRHAETVHEPPPPPVAIDEVRARVVDVLTTEEFYGLMASRGLNYGPAFRVLSDQQRTDDEGLARIQLPDSIAADAGAYQLHPALGDACMQLVAGTIPRERDGSYTPYTYLPTGLKRLRIIGSPADAVFAYARRTSSDNRPSPDVVQCDVFLLDEAGQVLVELHGVRVHRLGRAALQDAATDVRDWLYRVNWQPQAIHAVAPVSGDDMPGTQQTTWLLLADRGGVAAALAERLRGGGDRCVLVLPGDRFQRADASDSATDRDTYTIDPQSAEHYGRLLEEILTDDAPRCEAVVHLWSLDLPTGQGDAAPQLDDARRLSCASALSLVQACARSTRGGPSAVWLVTRGAQAVQDRDDVAVAQAPLWGMGRVAALEHADLNCRLVDLDPAVDAQQQVSDLLDELHAAGAENQIAVRAGRRYVARLATARDALPADGPRGKLTVPAGAPFRMGLSAAGTLDGLRFDSFSRTPPGAGQVELEVRAAGLNFSDVLKAMGLYPGLTDSVVPMGIECSGVVTAVGPGVTRFKVGDPVMGVAPHCFASHAVTAEYALVHQPMNISGDEAATIPITFLTAYYALVRLAHLQPGERVLIHAGAGGVGLAAIQIAQHIGAEIFATAGSDEKRQFLRSLGVPHVMSSRTLEFADQIMERTGREGVDVVLNSLPGEAIPKSLSVLRAYGRFLEIGKTDIYQNRMLGLLPFQDNLSYSAIDLDRMLRQRPDYIREMFAELMERFVEGAYQPLPHTRFAVEDAVGAFRYMQQRKNIGKVIISLEDRPSGEDGTSSGSLAREQASYLVTGGLGALGLQVADWLVQQGARHLALMGRRSPTGPAAAAVEALEQAGVRVAVVQGDVADRSSLAAALAQIPADFPPLRGVVHAAGVLADSAMLNMDLASLEKVMAPKVQGAWNLHEATQDMPLDFFVLFSSVACILGSPGQANYAAGNAFLDGLAHFRRARGLPATSINWGPWAASGMAAESAREGQLSARGMDMLPARESLQLLGELLRRDTCQLAVMSARWAQMRKLSSQGIPPLLRDVAPAGDEDAMAADSAEDRALREQFVAADLPQRVELLRDFFTAELARIMGMDQSQLDIQQPLNTLGLDSLMAIELKNNIETRLKVVLPMARFMEGPSVATLSDYVAEAMDKGAVAAPVATVSPATGQQQDTFPLSRGQQALWFIQRLAPDSTAYSICDAVRVHGPLNLDALQAALQAMVDRHAVLRTTFHDEDGRPYQKVHSDWPVTARVKDASQLSEAEVRRQIAAEIHKPFDLERGPLLRVFVLRQSDTLAWITFVVHHIVADFWSLVACTDEFRQLYEAATQGETAELPAPKLAYADFARWQAELLASPEGDAHWAYWRDQLQGELPLLELPTDRPRPPLQTYNGALAFCWLDPELTAALKGLAEAHGATLNMILLAAFHVLLHRYSGQDDILIGTPTSGRTRAEFAQVVGYFVNPVVIRSDLSGNPSTSDFVDQVRDRMLGALDHQDYPLPLLVERFAPPRDPSRSPLMQAVFVMQKAQIMHGEGLTPFLMGQSGARLQFGGLTFESMTLEQWVAPFDISLAASEANDGTSLGMQYNTDLFDESTVQRMMDHYETLLSGMLADPQRGVDEILLLTEPERQQLMAWAGTATDFPRTACLHHLFQHVAREHPDVTAVSDGRCTLTYAEVNRRANRLARHLRNLGAEKDAIVALLLDRDADLIVALLAVLKSGAAYLALDPKHPSQRLALMLQDADARVIVTQQSRQAALPRHTVPAVVLDDPATRLETYDGENLDIETSPTDLAYVIYTSGSTGRPKGVACEHRGAVNLLDDFDHRQPVRPGDGCSLWSSLSFDVSVYEMFTGLCYGGTIHLAPEEQLADSARFFDWLQQHQIAIAYVPPFMLDDLDTWLHQAGNRLSLRRLLVGVEPIAESLLGRIQSAVPGLHIVNAYGPTEATVMCAAYDVPTGDRPPRRTPVGKPVKNTEIYLLDDQLEPVPIGVPGTLYVGGAGLARGYLNRPELTDETFIPHPFSADRAARLYNTGDLARYLPDGNIHFIGRRDHQVKMRGFRIELGEVQSVLDEHPSVKQSVVTVCHDRAGTKRLAAFVEPSGHPAPKVEQLREYLNGRLPDYMIPSVFTVVETMPLNRSGKIDRQALPEPAWSRSDLATTLVAPRDEVEVQLAQIWEQLLGVSPIGVKDNFFDLGGHSLMAVQLVSRIQARFGHELPLATLVQGGTIESLAALLRQPVSRAAFNPLVAIQPHGTRPPLFCLPPVGGNVLCYHELARRLGDDQPVYALQARGVAGDEPPHSSLDDMIDEYLAAIRQVQPDGPYRLVGWSSGGVLAYETGRRLKESGSEVSLVALIDAVAPAHLPVDIDDEARILCELVDFLNRFLQADIQIAYDELARLDSDQRIETVLQHARRTAVLPPEIDRRYVRRFIDVCIANLRAIADYEPVACDLPLVQFRPEVADSRLDERLVPDLGWCDLVDGRVDCHEVPGDHVTMLTGDGAAQLSCHLRTLLADHAAQRATDRAPSALTASPAPVKSSS